MPCGGGSGARSARVRRAGPNSSTEQNRSVAWSVERFISASQRSVSAAAHGFEHIEARPERAGRRFSPCASRSGYSRQAHTRVEHLGRAHPTRRAALPLAHLLIASVALRLGPRLTSRCLESSLRAAFVGLGLGSASDRVRSQITESSRRPG